MVDTGPAATQRYGSRAVARSVPIVDSTASEYGWADLRQALCHARSPPSRPPPASWERGEY